MLKERKKKMLPICRKEFLHMYVQNVFFFIFFFHIYSFSPSGVGRGGSLEGMRRKERSGEKKKKKARKEIKSQAFFSSLGAKNNYDSSMMIAN